MLTDFETYKATTRTINRISTIRDLHRYLQSIELDPNVVATSFFHLANLWSDKQTRASTPGRDADDPDVQAYLQLQAMLPQRAILHMPLYPTEARVAIGTAVAQLSWGSEDALNLLEVLAVAVMADFEDQVPDDRVQTNLVLLATTYVTAGCYNSQFMDWLGTTTVKNLDKFIGPEDLANIFHAFLEARHLHQGLLDASRRWLLPFLQAPTAADISLPGLVCLGLGYAIFDAGDLELYSLLLGAVGRSSQLKQMEPTTACCLQVLYVLVSPTGAELPRKAVEAMQRVVRSSPAEVVRPCMAATITPELIQAILEAGASTEEELKVQGALAGQQLEAALSLLALPVERNVPVADGCILVHARTQYKGQEVAVQICDRDCFQTRPYWRFKGTLLNEMRALELLGYRVVALPWFEWDRLVTDADRAAYLAKRLSAAAGGTA